MEEKEEYIYAGIPRFMGGKYNEKISKEIMKKI